MKNDIVVIGAGIVGLASAYQVLKKRPDTSLIILEKEDGIARHQTGHNSGVIHSGIYYKPGSLKAKNCIGGYHQLLEFCDAHNVTYDLCGKVIVATADHELPYLEMLYERGQANGLDGLRMLDGNGIREVEPHCAGIKGIWVPQTGIIDYMAVARAYRDQIEAMGGKFRFGCKVAGIEHGNEGYVVKCGKNEVNGTILLNCAGLYSDRMTQMEHGRIDSKIIPFRGEYYMLKENAKHLVRNLIYPVPDPNFPFLGVHFTRMMNGHVEAGPNAVLAFGREAYKKTNLNPSELMETLAWPGFRKVARKYWRTGLGEMYRSWSKKAFTKALQRLIPEIKTSDLMPAESGIRAQACERNGFLLDDFKIIENPHSVHVINAPSPAATSSLSIGDTVANMVIERL